MEMKCIIIDDEHHTITHIAELITITPGVTHEKSFDNAFDALTYLHDLKHVDIVFLDIEMPQINGIEAAKLLWSYCDFLVLITAHTGYCFFS